MEGRQIMKYFLHDASAFDDEKITELYLKFGYEGLGLFYTILEKISKQEKPIKTAILKTQLHVGKRLEKCWKFMEEIGLISSTNGDTFNKNILNYAKNYQIKKEKNAERIREWRANKDFQENVTHYTDVTEHVRNAPKVKVSKEKVGKDSTDTTVSVRKTKVLRDEADKKLKEMWDSLEKDKRSIYNFIKDHNPQFIEPYVFMWNIWAHDPKRPHKKAQVDVITEKRRTHFKKRLKEKEFDFLKILEVAAISPFVLKEDSKWFDFEWIIGSQNNYVKLLEGKYKGEVKPDRDEDDRNDKQIDQATEDLMKEIEKRKVS